jgi:hypothetical protein
MAVYGIVEPGFALLRTEAGIDPAATTGAADMRILEKVRAAKRK